MAEAQKSSPLPEPGDYVRISFDRDELETLGRALRYSRAGGVLRPLMAECLEDTVQRALAMLPERPAP